MAEKEVMSFQNGTIQLSQQLETRIADPGEHHSAVFGFAAAGDQTSLLETIQKPCNIGVAAYHSVPDFPARKARRGSTENSQYVVLGRRYLCGPQHRLQPSSQLVRGDGQGDEDLLFQDSRAAAVSTRMNWVRHTYTICVITIKIERGRQQILFSAPIGPLGPDCSGHRIGSQLDRCGLLPHSNVQRTVGASIGQDQHL